MAGRRPILKDSTTVPVRMPMEMKEQLQAIADERMTSVSDLLRQAALKIINENEESTDG